MIARALSSRSVAVIASSWAVAEGAWACGFAWSAALQAWAARSRTSNRAAAHRSRRRRRLSAAWPGCGSLGDARHCLAEQRPAMSAAVIAGAKRAHWLLLS
jgi:hypothetical protein